MSTRSHSEAMQQGAGLIKNNTTLKAMEQVGGLH